MSGYLLVETRGASQYYLSFSSQKCRDRVCDDLMQRIKSTNWQFDKDVVIGARNGDAPAFEPRSPTTTDNVERKKAETSQLGLRLLFSAYGLFDGNRPGDEGEGEGRRMWREYMEKHGTEVGMIKDYKRLRELILKTGGIPNHYRGDLWMLFTGAWYSRPQQSYYEDLVREKMGKVGVFTSEIEKDVHRSLPEHPAYQCDFGLNALRRVLTAYSWRNGEVGYAQALNIISAVLMLYLREDDAFWLLSHIVERILPDHYTKTLVGSVVDQKVFEFLVRAHLPALWKRLDEIHLDLSTVSVPWFVCLFLNTLALNSSVKLLDCFFLDGSKFLFWFALSVLKINEKSLMESRDDDIFMAVIKDYFGRLGQIDTEATSTDTTDINEMSGSALFEHTLTLAYGLFAGVISTEQIVALRATFRLSVVHGMDASNKISQTRTLADLVSLSVQEVGIVYDQVQFLEFAKEERRQHLEDFDRFLQRQEVLEYDIRNCFAEKGGWGLIAPSSLDLPGSGGAVVEDRSAISLLDFRRIFAAVSPWKSDGSRGRRPSLAGDKLRNINLIDRIYVYSSVHFKMARKARINESRGGYDAYIVDLATVIQVLDIILKQPLNSRMRFLFDIHDLDGDGFLNNSELTAVMDSLLEIFHRDDKSSDDGSLEERYLKSISSFLNNALKLGSNKGAQPVSAEGMESTEYVAPGSPANFRRPSSRRPSLANINSASSEGGQDTLEYVAPVSPPGGSARRSGRPSLTGAKADYSQMSVKLSFNEFLLAGLSQSLFAEVFDRKWKLESVNSMVYLT